MTYYYQLIYIYIYRNIEERFEQTIVWILKEIKKTMRKSIECKNGKWSINFLPILQLQYHTCINVYTIDMVLLTKNLNKKHSICVSTTNTETSNWSYT